MVSIIIPVYNAELYLETCLLSIEGQTESNWECLLVDDGSTDGSSAICMAWEKRNSRFKVLTQENSGVSVARNKALSVASGEWVMFVDADDWLEKNYVSEMLSAANNCDLVVSGQVREYGNHKLVYKPDKSSSWCLDERHALEFNSLNEKFLLYAPHEKLFRNDIISTYGIMFERGCSYGEDLQFVYAYLEYVKKIATLNVAMYHYRMADSGTLSTVFRKDKFSVDYSQWHIVYDFYKNHRLLTEDASNYLYKRLWGIVYDGLFLIPCMQSVSWKYILSILCIPEIPKLRKYEGTFNCSTWIKCAILNRMSALFFCYFKLYR